MMPRDLYAPTLLLPMLAHVLSHALRLLLSDGQDHELHANREVRKDKPSPPTVFLFSDCGRQGASEVMDEIGDVQSIECPDLVEAKDKTLFWCDNILPHRVAPPLRSPLGVKGNHRPWDPLPAFTALPLRGHTIATLSLRSPTPHRILLSDLESAFCDPTDARYSSFLLSPSSHAPRPLLLPSFPHVPTSSSSRSGIATPNERRPPAKDTGSQAAGAWKVCVATVQSRQLPAQRPCGVAGHGSRRLAPARNQRGAKGRGRAGPSGAGRGSRAADTATDAAAAHELEGGGRGPSTLHPRQGLLPAHQDRHPSHFLFLVHSSIDALKACV